MESILCSQSSVTEMAGLSAYICLSRVQKWEGLEKLWSSIDVFIPNEVSHRVSLPPAQPFEKELRIIAVAVGP